MPNSTDFRITSLNTTDKVLVHNFANSSKIIFSTLIFLTQKDVQETSEKNNILGPFPDDFISINKELENFKQFFVNQLHLGTDEINEIWRHTESCVRDILLRVREIEKKIVERVKISPDEVFCNPALNPLLAIGDSILLHGVIGVEETKKFFKNYISDCDNYTRNLTYLIEYGSETVVPDVWGRLISCLGTYLGFFELPVFFDKPFVVKYEQMLPAGRKIGKVGYSINLGYERSWHLEVVCPSSMELSYDPHKSYVEFENMKERFKPEEILGKEVGTSKDRYHYYKNKTWHDIDYLLFEKKILDQLSEGPRPSVTLWAKFKPDTLLLYSHWLGFFMGLLFLINFVLLFDPQNPFEMFQLNSQTENKTPFFLVTLAGPLVVFLMAVREKEGLTIKFLRNLKGGILGSVAIMYLYLILAILWFLTKMYLFAFFSDN